MKSPGSIRRLYEDQDETCKNLKARVEALVRPKLHDRWHYESRVKTIESFTLKIECGRFDPAALEDVFAATIVVRNGSEISDAVRIITDLFAPAYRRPEKDEETSKAPDAFPFDDLRLYVYWRDAAALPPTGLDGVLFEVQIKTFLQHAWSIATHDLIYKADEASWSKMRIAYQIKAMLEHAELSIQEAVKLSLSDALAKSDNRTIALRSFILLVNDLWGKENLPSDIRRLAQNIMTLANLVKLDANALRLLLDEEKAVGRGPLIGNLSPYGAVLQTLIYRKQEALNSALRSKQKKVVLIPAEVDLPKALNTIAWEHSAVFIRPV